MVEIMAENEASFTIDVQKLFRSFISFFLIAKHFHFFSGEGSENKNPVLVNLDGGAIEFNFE